MNVQKKFKKLGTHNGKFHADEVIATAILKELFEVEIIRTRDINLLNTLDIVYDVGGGEFDHHGPDKVYRDNDNATPYASSGLIWRKFGSEVIKFKYPHLNEDEVENLFNYIDRIFIEGVDALDNGIWIDKTEIPLFHVSNIVEKFNPNWNSNKNEDEAFNEAVDFVSVILRNSLEHRISVLAAKNNVIEAFNKRPRKEILFLETYCPYGYTLKDIDVNNEVLYVIYPKGPNFAIQAVRNEDNEDKKKLPLPWAGLTDEKLSEVTGVPGCIFCHTGRFIAVANSLDGIMALAKLAIDNEA